MTELTVGFSTCPNDTFVFHAMVNNLIETQGINYTPQLFDIEELNQRASKETYHISKLSFYAYLKLKDKYEILDSGSALGFGCGPMLVGKSGNIPAPDARIAIPGELTTAYLLLRLWQPDYQNIEIARFDEILKGVQSGKYDAGLIIHEGRFVYEQYGCQKIIDLGEWWESEIGHPIPLGCIAIRKDSETVRFKTAAEQAIKSSVEYAWQNSAASRPWVKQHAQELSDDVIDSHIGLYVNNFTKSLGEEGRLAVETLEKMAQERKIL